MKQASEIYADMKQTFQEKTGADLSDSSDLAVRLYAAAAELETLYAYSDWALGQSFPQTATGEYLDYHAALRGLTRRVGMTAAGTLRFSVSEARGTDLDIPAGTVCTTADQTRFVTTQAGAIPAGSLYADVPARAESPGPGGCADAGTVTTMVLPPVGVEACTNPAPFTGGEAEEDDEALRARVLESFLRLPNGANAAFYAERALADPRVTGVQVLPRRQGIGTVDVVIATSEEDAEAVQADLQAELDAVREIGTDVTVTLPEEQPVDVTVTFWPRAGVAPAAAEAAVRRAVNGCFTGALVGKSLYLTALNGALYGTGLLENFRIVAPAADVAGAEGVLPVPGTVTVTEGA